MSIPLPEPRPRCPICKEKMQVVHYIGYYEEFSYWQCNCEDKEFKPFVSETWTGSYT